MNQWRSIADLAGAEDAKIALIGAPLSKGSVTVGACDRGPATIRAAMKRISTYDLETGLDLSARFFDYGDVDVASMMPAEAFAPLRTAFSKAISSHDFSIILGGNNAITRAGVHALETGLAQTGLITFDAHFDMRDTSAGLTNGNPVQALIDDGMPGANIAQIGLAPFANAKYMHDVALREGNRLYTLSECRARGIADVVTSALDELSKRCAAIYVDFDIDVIERGMAPGAPGARPGGLSTDDFFVAARMIARHPKVKAVDVAEFDPALDLSDISALIAARWVAETFAGLAQREG